MNCSSGGFPTLCHNKLRDFTTAALSEVFHDMAIEPLLQPYLESPFSMPWPMCTWKTRFSA